MNNYRATFSIQATVDYWNRGKENYNFIELPDLYRPILRRIFSKAKSLGIKNVWYFFEPYAEVNWLCDKPEASQKLNSFISKECEHYKMKDLKFMSPEDGQFADWFCKNEEEREFGALRHGLCGQFVMLYDSKKDAVDRGKGLEEQVKRTIHVLCNPLGINYDDEARICLSRYIACKLFKWFKFGTAVWIYKNIFRQKY